MHRHIFHDHIENEIAAFADSIWVKDDVAAALLNNLFHDCQAKSNSFIVHLCRALEFAKLREKQWLVRCINTYSWVFDMYNYAAFSIVIAREYFDVARWRKLKRIFY